MDSHVRLVLFSRDMDGGRVLQDALQKGGAAWLERNRALYVADVSRMPGLIRRVIAKPRMRRRGYPMLLDETGDATASLPHKEGHATLLFLDAGRLTRIEYVTSAQSVRAE